MSKVIDLYLDLPTGEDLYLKRLSMFCLNNGKVRFPGYRTYGNIASNTANNIGLNIDELDKIVEEKGEEEFKRVVIEAAKKVTITMDQFVAQLDNMGVEWGFTGVHDRNNERTAEICNKYPDRFLGAAYIDPNKGMAAVRELEYCIKELNLAALYISPIRMGLKANDKKCYPLYAKACELGIPVFIYSHMNFMIEVPMDIGHPRNIDDVARDFPELKIMVTCGGWPWVSEFVGLALRHLNLYLNMEINEPRMLTESGKGYEPLLYAIKHHIGDKFCFASNWAQLGIPLETLIQQVRDLPLSEEIKENILYTNAARFFGKI